MRLHDVVDRIASVTGKTPRWHGERAQCCCPAHKDDTASLSVAVGKSGAVVVHCHAGCEAADVIRAAGLTWEDLAAPGTWKGRAENADCRQTTKDTNSTKDGEEGRTAEAGGTPAPRRDVQGGAGRVGGPGAAESATRGRIVVTYPYRGADGELLFEVVRFEPKDFRQRRPDGKGGWTWSLGATPRPLYRLPELLAADMGAWTFVVEGEKDADNLWKLGVPATTNAGGAGKWKTLADDSALEGRRICIVPDQDEPKKDGRRPGEEHGRQVAKALHGRAAEIRVLRLPEGIKDISVWLAPRVEWQEPEEVRAELLRMVENAEPWRGETTGQGRTVADDVVRLRADTGNAARFARAMGERARYCPGRGAWLLWDGRRWAPDERMEIVRHAKRVALDIFDEAKESKEDNERRALAAWALKSQRADRLNAMMSLARCELAVTVGELDTDVWLLNVNNGTINLKTGDLREHRRGDLITRLAPVEYDPSAKCALWTAFLDRIMGGNAGMIGYLQRICGMCLTGDVGEQVLPIFYGTGANGKGVLLDTIAALLGDYATQAPPGLIDHRDGSEEHKTEIADLCGRRLVVASETEEGGRMKLQLVKRLTGDAILKGRFMRQDFFEFRRTHKLILATNNRPIVRESTNAVWRRLRLVPFAVTIPEAEQDRGLLDKLRGEWPGVLAWAVRGCLAWQREGLGVPQDVRSATQEYEADSDPLLDFIADKCAMEPGARVTRAVLWSAYNEWAETEGERYSLGKTSFFERIRRRPGVDEYQAREYGKPRRGFEGIRLQTQASHGDNAGKQVGMGW